MHSRIIELSKDPILKHERMCESSVPDWFYHSIADYTDADTDRDHDIKWFLDAVARVVDVAEDGLSGTISYDTPYAVVQHENRHFRHQRGRKAKYLEDPINDKGVQREALAVLADAMGEDLGG